MAIDPGTFALADHLSFLAAERDSIDAFRARQGSAFATERAAWAAAGEFDRRDESEPEPAPDAAAVQLPPGGILIEAPCTACIWTVDVRPGDDVAAGQRLLTLEAMKMETPVDAPVDGSVIQVLAAKGEQVSSGSALLVLVPSG